MEIDCGFCGRKRREYPYQIKKGNGKYCSRNCANKANASKLAKARLGTGNPMSGKRPWNYIDGKRQHKYAGGQWRRFAEKLRQKSKCKICKRRDNLVVHHIIPVKIGGTDEIKNLMVLCRECHNRLHAEMAKGVVHA